MTTTVIVDWRVVQCQDSSSLHLLWPINETSNIIMHGIVGIWQGNNEIFPSCHVGVETVCASTSSTESVHGIFWYHCYDGLSLHIMLFIYCIILNDWT